MVRQDDVGTGLLRDAVEPLRGTNVGVERLAVGVEPGSTPQRRQVPAATACRGVAHRN
jgi:hypothetical protein